MNTPRRMMLRALCGAALVPWMPLAAQAHPYHASSAVADVRSERLEVLLEVAPEDLQEALTRQAARRVDIDRDADVPRLAQAYASARFELQGPKGPVELRWIGCEVKANIARLYFEFGISGTPSSYRVRNTFFFEIAPAQVNRVEIRSGARRHTLRFRPGTPAQCLLPAPTLPSPGSRRPAGARTRLKTCQGPLSRPASLVPTL